MQHNALLQAEEAIAFVKDSFEKDLIDQLSLTRISSPLVVLDGTGINDDLNGVERAVKFPIKALNEQKGVIVHSLAKWKRMRLEKLGIDVGKGILTDMRALRPDEDYSPLHSIYVDQWDWEKHINTEQRTLAYLQGTVERIYTAIKDTENAVCERYPIIKAVLPPVITFVHAEDLLQRYPNMTPKERETALTREYGAVFLIGIGGKLSNGEPHDGRAPDYDDWSTANGAADYKGLNGDILLWYEPLQLALEVSSMGVRVDESALRHQLALRNCSERAELAFHQLLLTNQLPQSIGGGIGQSRIVMFMLRKLHIGQVQVSIWPDEVRATLNAAGIDLL